VSRGALTWMALLCACSGSKEVERPRTEPAVEVRRADIAACHEAMEQSDAQTSAVRVKTIVSACSELWLDPTCREAWIRALDEPPESRAEGVIQRCATSICPTLAKPRPALCSEDLSTVDLLDEQPDWGELWKEFSGVVLARDLGLRDDDAVGAILGMRLLQLVAISGTAPTEEVDE